ncbi:MAG: hypothetical protein IPK78_20415 [Rhodospirillales bacterium]|nr:hypothetical protein [Rhodospirillales bacterium]
MHYFAFSSWRTAEPGALVRHLEELGTIAETRFCDTAGEYLAIFATEDGLRRVDPSSGETWSAGRAAVIAQLASVREERGSLTPAEALSGMRRTIAEETVLRVVACGRVAGDTGRMPGIVEEALLHAAAGRIVVALVAFGGASRDVAVALGVLPESARVRIRRNRRELLPGALRACRAGRGPPAEDGDGWPLAGAADAGRSGRPHGDRRRSSSYRAERCEGRRSFQRLRLTAPAWRLLLPGAMSSRNGTIDSRPVQSERLVGIVTRLVPVGPAPTSRLRRRFELQRDVSHGRCPARRSCRQRHPEWATG